MTEMIKEIRDELEEIRQAKVEDLKSTDPDIFDYPVLECEIDDARDAIQAIDTYLNGEVDEAAYLGKLKEIYTQTTSARIYDTLGKNIFREDYAEVERIVQERKAQEAKDKKRMCPRCGVNELKEGHLYSLSRRDNKTVICNECGTAEALEELM
jgi:predicted RNA-binding Zn-ribbon protein involved in translation (DUF1610 family)